MNGKPTRLTQWLLAIPSAWQAVIALGLAAILGMKFGGYLELPGRVADVETRQADVEVRQGSADRERELLLRLGCTVVRSVDPANEPAECATVFRNAGQGGGTP